MAKYYCVRVWQVRAGEELEELEELAGSGLAEMQRWIPGVEGMELVRESSSTSEEGQRYMMMLTFRDQQAYMYWRQMEEEGLDFWERYAAVLTQWEQLSMLVAEYAGEMVLDMAFDKENSA